MSPELDKKLCNKYPELFRDRFGDVTRTAMCWGFQCGNGWYSLIESICEFLMVDVNRLKFRLESDYYSEKAKEEIKLKLIEATKKIPVVVQVKEKFGGLRFYAVGVSEEQIQYIGFVEGFSFRVCEECGAMKDTTVYNIDWVRTLCPFHADEQYGSEAASEYRNRV